MSEIFTKTLFSRLQCEFHGQMQLPAHTAVLKAPPLVHLWKLMVEQNGSPGGSGMGSRRSGLQTRKSHPIVLLSL